MAPFTRSSKSMGPIDPGDEFFDNESQDHDVEMIDSQEEARDAAVVDGNKARGDPIENTRVDRLVIAIDFGTTFSSVAYAIIPKGTVANEINIREVRCIGNYPGYEPPLGMPDVRQDVPTELWYDDRAYDLRNCGINNSPTNGAQMMGALDNNDSSSGEENSDSEQSQFEEDRELTISGSRPPATHNEVHATQYWGFGVQQKLSMVDIPRDEARPLTRFKLSLTNFQPSLDTNKLTDDIRTDINVILKRLLEKKIIKSKSDIFADFLAHLLTHTKDQLLLEGILQPDMVVQFVLCVPAKWPMNACRIMQTALEQAVKAAGLGEQADSGVHNLFMISEPEAAAECIFAEENRENYILVSKIQSLTRKD